MKYILLIVFIASGTQCLAQSVGNGSYIVIRGAVEDCKAWSDRILDVAKVEDNKPVTLLNIPDISVMQLNSEQINLNLLTTIQNLTGNQPESITVEILESEAEYQSIVKEYGTSLNALLSGSCPFGNKSKLRGKHPIDPSSGKLTADPEYLEENIQRIQKQDIACSVI